ncbi:hypothetical protein [Psychrosphaera haliotis]|uniref:hypothetical protein n=1 Tax=Psychrosphaera haliotis TaxID=555083 RepID=UPI001E4E5CEF|nr:hypothetical protein [Psychrosphaera haliotis]
MNKFQNLSVFIKINVITLIALIALIIVIVLNALASQENNKNIDDLKDRRYQIAKISTANSFIINRIDELYSQAVSFGDEELISKANEEYQVLKRILKAFLNWTEPIVRN